MMYRFYSKKVQERLKSLGSGSGIDARDLGWFDRHWAEAETVLLTPPMNVLYTEHTLWFASRMSWSDNILKSICDKYGIKPNYVLYKRCEKYVMNKPFELREEFLDTYSVNPDVCYHALLISRAQKETQVYGTMPLYRWFVYFCSLASVPYIELCYISGLVYKSYPNVLFKMSKKDNSRLEDFSLYYNIVNIVECLLNICELRMSLIFSKISVGGKMFDLYEILDEIAGIVPVSPKIRIKAIRNFLNFAVRHAGAYSKRPSFVCHDGADPISVSATSNLFIREDDAELLGRFLYIPTTVNALNEGRVSLRTLKLFKLLDLIEHLLIASFLPTPEVERTNTNDFTVCCSFLLNIMRIAGYGRGMKRFAINESKPERDDSYGDIASTVKDMWMNFHKQALNAGFRATTNDDFIHKCVGSWRSTSAGMPPLKIKVTIDGEDQSVSVRKKMAMGAVLGKKLFSKEYMSIKLDKNNPGKVGARDVPYKATRIIYPIPMPTLHAMIAVSQHLVDYASHSSKPGMRVPYSNIPFNCDHIASGSEETTGVRIVDNLSTIIVSGSQNYINLDMDMAGYDSCCVYKNFRKPMIDALKEMSNNELFGPDNIPWEQMVDYAFGNGYVHDTYWDAGRLPILYLNEAGLIFRKEIESKAAIVLLRVNADRNEKLEKLQGATELTEGEYYVLSEEYLSPDLFQYFSIGYVMDGSDLVHLTSEGSGEKTTLCANSIMNLALQARLFIDIKECKLGRCLRPVVNHAIGDDISITMEIIDYSFTSEDVEEFMLLLKSRLELYGFDISLPKTCFLPRQSEFVQTYAIRGLYIPKDQIMTISSERPRIIDDAIAFVDSFKRLLLSRVSRGMNESAALLHVLYHYRVIMAFDLRRMKISFNGPIPRDRLGDFQIFLRAPTFAEHVRVASFKQHKDKKDVVVFYPSIILATLPRNAGGIGLNCRTLALVHDSAFYLYVISQLPEREMQLHMLIYSFFYEIEYPSGFTDSGSVRVDFNSKSLHSLIPINMLFHERSIMLVQKMPFSIGRLNMENVPLSLAKKGLQFENFMREVDFKQKERDFQVYLSKLGTKRLSIKSVTMELVPLCFKYGLVIHSGSNKESFIFGLQPEYQILIRRVGISLVLSQRRDRRERIRMLISRDPALRSLRTPEDIYNIFRKYGINDESDRQAGLVLLLRMGFHESIASEIVETFLNFLEFTIEDGLYGALTDDLSSMINLITPESFNLFSFPNNIQGMLRYQLYIFSTQMCLYNFMGEIRNKKDDFNVDVPFTTPFEATQMSSNENMQFKQLGKFMSFPRIVNIFKNYHSRKEAIPLIVNLTADLQMADST
uniref:RNA-directed RNA polymerase n=2 Tax=unclassified Orbivirus TaxID=40068 RepID=A0AAU7L128_9REOV